MIWHIFRKDCRILRNVIGGVAVANALAAATWIAVGPFEQVSELARAAYLLSSLALICMVLVVVMAVHEDPVIGVTRDWSVRPIRRRDMLLAKVVFALIAAHGPLLIIDFVEALVFGFPVAQAAGAAAARGFYLFCSITLPATVIAAFTRTMTTWIVAALIWTIGTTVLFAILSVGQSESLPLFNVLGWLPHLAPTAIILCASAVTLPLLYARKFVSAAGAMLAGPALASLALLIPWPILFEIQRSLSPREELAGDVQVRLDADALRIQSPEFMYDGYARVVIPMHLSGLTDDRMLVIDNAAVRLIENGSTVFHQENTHCFRSTLRSNGVACESRSPIASSDGIGDISLSFAFNLPLDVYERLRDRPLQMEIDFALTLLHRTGNALISSHETQWFDVGGNRCLVRMGEKGADAQLGCLHTTSAPTCQRTFINAKASVERSVGTQCRSDYSPFAVRKFPDVIDRTRPSMSGASQISMTPPATRHDSTVRLETYTPQAHFRRSLILPAIRFMDHPRRTSAPPWTGRN